MAPSSPSNGRPARPFDSPEQEAFFEQKVRPLLVTHCQECHGEKKQEGGLRLDSRAAILKGSESGPAIVVSFVVFFVIKSGNAVGWKASGFENGLNDETVKLLTTPAQKPPLLRDALTNLRIATINPQPWSEDVSEALGIYGQPAPERACRRRDRR